MIGIAPDRNFDGPGVRAAQVTPRGPAQRADMQDGDVIVALGDHEVEDLQDLVDALGNLAPGDEVDVALLRGEERLVIRVTLGAR